MIDPEPRTKRTVEGDLGVFVNARRVAAMTDEGEDEERLEWLRAIPSDERETEVTPVSYTHLTLPTSDLV